MLKLNLGSGFKRIDGFVNVDRFPDCNPDFVHDLEVCPYPFDGNSVDEIVMNHVLEHLGRTEKNFNEIIKEIYRICAHGAIVHIKVVHPRHEYFLGDPSHVRAITPMSMVSYDKRRNEIWVQKGSQNTPLGIIHGVNFVLLESKNILASDVQNALNNGLLAEKNLSEMILRYNNIVEKVIMSLKVIKEGV